jgi:hypothetical protein
VGQFICVQKAVDTEHVGVVADDDTVRCETDKFLEFLATLVD